MIADISLPDTETRIAILKTKCQERNINLPDNVLEFIANNIPRNIRELEGALNRMVAYQRVQSASPDLEAAKTLLKNIISAPNKIIGAKKIIQAVAESYDLREKDLLLVSRKKEIVKPRQVAMYLLRNKKLFSFHWKKIRRERPHDRHTRLPKNFQGNRKRHRPYRRNRDDKTKDLRTLICGKIEEKGGEKQGRL